MSVSIGTKGLKELSDQKDGSDIRMSLAQAREMGIILDDRDIIELFSKGIAVDIVIKKVGDGDTLPARLQKQLSDFKRRKGDKDWLFEGLFDIKIARCEDKYVLDRFDILTLLMEAIPGDRYKIGSMMEEYGEFSRIKIIDGEKSRYLSIKEAKTLISSKLPPGKYELDLRSVDRK